MSVLSPTCLHCNEVIKVGRSDKKFCDIGCKDAYYNTLKANELKEIRRVDGILKKNRRALKSLYDPQNREKKFTKESLVRAGFEFGFLTHIAETKFKGGEIHFCYDYRYREVEADQYQLYPTFPRIKVKGGYEMVVK